MSVIIFGGSNNTAKVLADGVQLNVSGAAIKSVSVDPASVATSGNPGDVVISTSTNKTYQKQDSGTTTNWIAFVTQQAPTFDTSITDPLVIGGTGSGSSLELRSTSGTGSTDFIKFNVGNNGGTEAMRIINSGKVGIGTTNPGVTLDVLGVSTSISNTDPFFTNGSSNHAYFDYTMPNGTSNAWTTPISIRTNYGVGSQGFYSASDQRLKKDVVELNDDKLAIKFIEESRPVHFKWIESDIPNYGFIAQDLMKLGFPELVTATREENNKLLERTIHEDGSISFEGMKMSVNYDQIVAILTHSIKFQEKRLKYLENEIKELKSLINGKNPE